MRSFQKHISNKRVRLSLSAFALILLPIAAVAGDATQCVRLVNKQLVNMCNQTISVVWCIDDPSTQSNCNRGYNMESDIAPGVSIIASPLSPPNQSINGRWAACLGSNSAAANGFEYTCR
jgi:hypothetical protein